MLQAICKFIVKSKELIFAQGKKKILKIKINSDQQIKVSFYLFLNLYYIDIKKNKLFKNKVISMVNII